VQNILQKMSNAGLYIIDEWMGQKKAAQQRTVEKCLEKRGKGPEMQEATKSHLVTHKTGKKKSEAETGEGRKVSGGHMIIAGKDDQIEGRIETDMTGAVENRPHGKKKKKNDGAWFSRKGTK